MRDARGCAAVVARRGRPARRGPRPGPCGTCSTPAARRRTTPDEEDPRGRRSPPTSPPPPCTGSAWACWSPPTPRSSGCSTGPQRGTTPSPTRHGLTHINAMAMDFYDAASTPAGPATTSTTASPAGAPPARHRRLRPRLLDRPRGPPGRARRHRRRAPRDRPGHPRPHRDPHRPLPRPRRPPHHPRPPDPRVRRPPPPRPHRRRPARTEVPQHRRHRPVPQGRPALRGNPRLCSRPARFPSSSKDPSTP